MRLIPVGFRTSAQAEPSRGSTNPDRLPLRSFLASRSLEECSIPGSLRRLQASRTPEKACGEASQASKMLDTARFEASWPRDSSKNARVDATNDRKRSKKLAKQLFETTGFEATSSTTHSSELVGDEQLVKG